MKKKSDKPRRPLGVVVDGLNSAQLKMLEGIENFDMWFVVEKLSESSALQANEVDSAIAEFKRYLALVGFGYEDLPVPNVMVDEVWHTFILFTREYAGFCQETIGRFVHHAPRTSRTAQSLDGGKLKFTMAYHHLFGCDNNVFLSAVSAEAKCCSTCRSATKEELYIS